MYTHITHTNNSYLLYEEVVIWNVTFTAMMCIYLLSQRNVLHQFHARTGTRWVEVTSSRDFTEVQKRYRPGKFLTSVLGHLLCLNIELYFMFYWNVPFFLQLLFYHILQPRELLMMSMRVLYRQGFGDLVHNRKDDWCEYEYRCIDLLICPKPVWHRSSWQRPTRGYKNKGFYLLGLTSLPLEPTDCITS